MTVQLKKKKKVEKNEVLKLSPLVTFHLYYEYIKANFDCIVRLKSVCVFSVFRDSGIRLPWVHVLTLSLTGFMTLSEFPNCSGSGAFI